MEKNFKVLMFANMYVDANNLERGIYMCTKPFIYHKEETIDNLIEIAKNIKDKSGCSFITDNYIDNLKQCKLIDIEISINPTQ